MLAWWSEADVFCLSTRGTTEVKPAPDLTGPATMTAMALVALESPTQFMVTARCPPCGRLAIPNPPAPAPLLPSCKVCSHHDRLPSPLWGW
jgi:hypothetical protein